MRFTLGLCAAVALTSAACAHQTKPTTPPAAAVLLPPPAPKLPAPATPAEPPEIGRLRRADAGSPPDLIRPQTPGPDDPWLRALTLPDFPITWNPRTLWYLDFYRVDPRGRRIMTSWIEQLYAYKHILERALVAEGLPRDLLAVSVIESGLRPGVTSPKSAGGFWQFLPDVGRAYGLRVGHWIDERRDPEASSVAAARYLQDLRVRFGTWELALAGFNAGHGAVMTAIVRYNTNDFFKLTRIEAGLPYETTEYVPKVMAVALVLRNQEAFGYAGIAPAPRFEYDTVKVPGGVTFAALSRKYSLKTEELERLNPALVRKRTPPDVRFFDLRVPPGRGAPVSEGLQRSPLPVEANKLVIVGPGETLARFARARRVPLATLRQLNAITNDNDVVPGTALLVPAAKTVPATRAGRRDGKGGGR